MRDSPPTKTPNSHVISQTFPEAWLVAICTRHTFPVNVFIPETKLIQSCLVSTEWEQMELWPVGIFLQMRINGSNCPPLWRYFCLINQCWTSNKYWHILLLAFLFSRIILNSCPSVNYNTSENKNAFDWRKTWKCQLHLCPGDSA